MAILTDQLLLRIHHQKIIGILSHSLNLKYFSFFLFIGTWWFFMRVFISEIVSKTTRRGYPTYYELYCELQSGLEIYVTNYDYDLEDFIGCHVDMLLSIMRSPYFELNNGINNQQFFKLDKYYSMELIDELKKKLGTIGVDNKRSIILTGEYIDYFPISEQ